MHGFDEFFGNLDHLNAEEERLGRGSTGTLADHERLRR